MKKLLAVLAAGCLTTLTYAQQDPQFTQNMFNKLYVNPAYAGHNESICFSGLYRTQWVNFDGAPKTGVFSFEAPFAKNRWGVGLNLAFDEIGFDQNLQAKLGIARHFPLGNGKFSIGVNGEYNQNQIDGDFIPPTQLPDPAIPTSSVSGGAFDLGAGLYYSAPVWYVGLSASHLLESEVELEEFSREYKRHHYGMLGFNLDLSPSVTLKPMVFVKNVTDNTTIDVNLNAHFNEKFWIGASWRNEDAFAALIGFTLAEKLRIGYSYDFTTSDVKDYSDGTHEFTLGYCFRTTPKITPAIRNVRFL